MNSIPRIALLGTATAVAVTSAMDATGYSVFSALPLLPITLLFWWYTKLNRQEMGLCVGRTRYYLWALAYPLAVMGGLAVAAWFAGEIRTEATDWNKALLNFVLMSSTGVLMTLLTEEGFFRGWLWGVMKRGGASDTRVLLATTLAFVVWHISAVTLETGFNPPVAQLPAYFVNATLLVYPVTNIDPFRASPRTQRKARSAVNGPPFARAATRRWVRGDAPFGRAP